MPPTPPLPQSLTEQILIPDGIYAGQQAILIQPPKPFPLMKFSQEVRDMIWHYVLDPEGTNNKIAISCATGGKSGVTSKAYIGGQKQRTACLLVNKEVRGVPYRSPDVLTPRRYCAKRAQSCTATTSSSTTPTPCSTF